MKRQGVTTSKGGSGHIPNVRSTLMPDLLTTTKVMTTGEVDFDIDYSAEEKTTSLQRGEPV